MVLWIFVPLSVAHLVLFSAIPMYQPNFDPSTLSVESFMAQGGGSLVFSILYALLAMIAQTFFTLALAEYVSKKVEGKSVTWQEAFTVAKNLLLDGVLTNLLMTVLLIGLFILLIVPGVIFSIYWSFALIAVALKGKKNMDALAYSKDIVTGRWWMTLGYFILLGLIVAIVSGVATFVVGFVLGVIFSIIPIPYITSLVLMLVSYFAQMFALIYSIFLFINWDKFREIPAVSGVTEVNER